MLEIMKCKEILGFIIVLSLLLVYDGIKQEPLEEENNSPLVVYQLIEDNAQYTIQVD